MKKTLFVGSATAIITPFKDGEIDFASFENIINDQLYNHTSAIVVCGTTGEPSTLSSDEQEQCVKFVVEKVNGQVPVIAGTGGNNTKDVIEKAKRYYEIGADAQLCVTPYYNKTTQKGLIAHYTAIADNCDLPIITYNVPGRTGVNMLPDTLAKIAEHENIIGHKEAHSDLAQASEMFRLLDGDLSVYSGMDELIVPMLSLGAKGVISVASNAYPQKVAELVASYLNGDNITSLNIQLQMLPFINALFKQTSPTPIKAALDILGLCDEEVRLPLVCLDTNEKEYLKSTMEMIK